MNSVSSKRVAYQNAQNEVTQDVADSEADDAKDECQKVEGDQDEDVDALDLEGEGEAGDDAVVDLEDVQQHVDQEGEEGGPEAEAQEAGVAPAEDVDDAADERQHHQGAIDHAIPCPQVSTLIDVNSHFEKGCFFGLCSQPLFGLG